MSTEHLIDRPAYADQCARCKAPILIAMDGGLNVAADIIPADVNAEIAAWLTKRWSWNVIRDPDTRQTHLRFRGLAQVKAGRPYPVVTGHRCPDGAFAFNPWRAPPPSKPKPAARKTPAVNNDAPVPF